MKRHLLFLILFTTVSGAKSQNFTGQWKGEFIDKSVTNSNFGSDKCEYVLELDVNNKKVSGTSYTYFTENGIRYYTICKLDGTIEPQKKYIEVTEVERTKTNIPSYIPNCFQVHKLTYFKNDKGETLEGNWIPAPKQSGNCGFGTTILTRRTLINAYSKSVVAKNKIDDKKTITRNTTKPSNSSTEKYSPKQNSEPVQSPDTDITKQDLGVINKENNNSNPADSKVVQRKNTVLKTIEVDSKTIKVDLYDNGDIDGDVVSLYFNGKLLLSNKKLTDKAITLSLELDDAKGENELLMYAETLGTIPPNTALMVVTDEGSRYEVRITSDLEKSGVIRFIHKTPK